MLVSNPRGNYHFLRGIGAYSSGVIADAGYEIVHATLATLIPVRAGFDLIAQHLRGVSRPVQALCAIELRLPRPFTFEGFAGFNESYRSILADADLLADGLNPISRTNVAPEVDPPSEPMVYGFSYSVTAGDPNLPPTFVVAGAGELIEDQYDVHHIVRGGETSDEAMREKAKCVMEHMRQRLEGLGVGWPRVNVVNIYTVQNIFPFLRDEIHSRAAAARQHGVRWHFTRPPIEGLEFEMDVRRVGGRGEAFAAANREVSANANVAHP